MVRDGTGIYGSLLEYSLLIALFFSTSIIFFRLWKNGKLDMDEEPGKQMMLNDMEETYDE